MKSLFINSSTKDIIVAIIIDNKISYLYKSEDYKDLSITLLPIVDEAFKKTNIKPNEIDSIFVTNGPGSFTGIRMGLTIAKVMAWSLKIKVIPISSLEFMASTKTNKQLIVPLIDARRGYVYAGVYDKDLNKVNIDSYILLDELKNKLVNKEVLYISSSEFEFSEKSDYDILKIISKHKNDTGINPHNLKPNYLKRTEAEENLKESGE